MAGYRLHQSSRLASFPEMFDGVFLSEDPLGPPVYTVVQNAGLGEWLLRKLAAIRGAVMAPRILLPEQALRFFALDYPSGEPFRSPAEGGRGLLFMDGMKLVFYKALIEALAADDPVYTPLRAYTGEGEERLWQLCDAVAGLFYSYGMNCLPLVQCWEAGGIYPEAAAADAGAEAWQRALWRRVFHSQAPYGHLSGLLSSIMESGKTYGGPPGRIVLFGSMFLGETGLRFFRYLANDLDVDHFIFVPSKVWGAGSLGSEARTAFLESSGTLSGDFGRFVPSLAPDEITALWDNPGRINPGGESDGADLEVSGPEAGTAGGLKSAADVSGGSRQADGFGQMSLWPESSEDDTGVNVSDEEVHPERVFHLDRASEGRGPLLYRLRESFIEDAPLAGSVVPDGSLAFHDVTGPRRAVEVLKDRILEALRDDPTLAPTQIGVLAPDIAPYAPYIETIFPSPRGSGGPDDLNCNITDLPAGTDAPYPLAFRALAELPGSRFGRNAILDLLDNPCFLPAVRNPDCTDVWKRLITDLNVRWGLDGHHRRENGAADGRIGSWRTAFERLLDGYCFDEGDGTELLPAYLGGDGDAEAAGVLMRMMDDLEADFRGLEKEHLALRDWTLRWESLVEKWILPRKGEEEDDEADRLSIKKIFRDLMALCDDVDDLSDFTDGRLSWTAFSSLMGEMAENVTKRRGRYLARGVTCASLKPMRAIPFRRIYVLGLDEGVWPKTERTPGFDFRDRVPKVIDLSRESVDRFALLETIFSAEDHLSLFYTGRDAERGDKTAPSSPVLELMEHIGPEAEKLVVKHPLNPFDAMSGEGPAASSSLQALELARVRYEGVGFSQAVSSSLPMDDEEMIDWRDLVTFLKNPVEFFFRRRVGASFESEEEDRSDDDVLEAESLDWWKWRSDAITGNPELLKRPKDLVDSFRERLSAEGAVADSAARGLQAEEWRSDAEAMAKQLDRLLREGLDLGESFACRLEAGGLGAGVAGGRRFSTDTAGVSSRSPLIIPAPIVSPAGAPPAAVIGLMDGLRFLNGPEGPDSSVWTLLDFVPSQNIRTSHNLSGWVRAVVLGAALGERRPKEIRVFRLGAHDFAARRYYFDSRDVPEKAGGEKSVLGSSAAILRSLVRVFRDGSASPLALYPELAEKIFKGGAGSGKGGGLKKTEGLKSAESGISGGAGLNGKEAVFSSPAADEFLADAALAAWNGILSDTRTPYSALRDCSWRRRFLTNPDFEGGAFRRAWEELYLGGGLL